MFYKYFVIDKNNNEIYSTIEARTKEDAMQKIKSREDILYVVEVTAIKGGKLSMQLTNTANTIRKNVSELASTVERKMLEYEKKKEQKEKETKEDLQQEVEEVTEELVTVKNMSLAEKIKFVATSEGKDLARNIAIVKELNKQGHLTEDKEVTIRLPQTKKSKKVKEKEPIKKTFMKKRKVITEDDLGLDGNKDILSGSDKLEVEEFEYIEQRFPNGKGKIRNKDILMMTKQWQLMEKSSVSISDAFYNLAQGENEKLNNMLLDIRNEIQQGIKPSEAMGYYPQYFDTTYLALIKVGQESSSLSDVLGEVVSYKEKADKIERKVKTAGVYPIILLGLLSVMGIVGSIFFIPMFKELYVDSDMPIPALTNLIFTIAGNLHIVIPSLFALFFIVMFLYRKFYPVKAWWDKIWHKLKVKLPIVKNITKIVYMYNFSSALSILLRNGTQLPVALDLTTDTINNMYVQEEIRDINDLVVRKGITLSDAIGQQELFDDIIRIVTLTGEKTGNFSQAFYDISEFYDKELISVIDATMEMIEPISIIVLGAIILPVAVGLYLPMLELSTGGFLDLD